MAEQKTISLHPYAKDETGNTYGRLTVLRHVRRGKRGGAHWECKCECGTVVVATGIALRQGKRISCGCALNVKKHGHCTNGKRTSEYNAWSSMVHRCDNPRCRHYKNYGGRGITVCDRWRESFENFLADVGPRPGTGYSIDRINNNGNYEPENVKWSTKLEQDNNRRVCRYVTIDSETHSVKQWARIIGCRSETIYHKAGKEHDFESAIKLLRSTFQR